MFFRGGQFILSMAEEWSVRDAAAGMRKSGTHGRDESIVFRTQPEGSEAGANLGSESGCIRKIRGDSRKFYLLDNSVRNNYHSRCFNFGQVWFRVYNPKGE